MSWERKHYPVSELSPNGCSLFNKVKVAQEKKNKASEAYPDFLLILPFFTLYCYINRLARLLLHAFQVSGQELKI